jgi:hypothetical protein
MKKPLGSIARMMIWLEKIERDLRAQIGIKLRGLRPLVAYKMLKKFKLLDEVTELIDKYQLDCFVTGGFAYDGLYGKFLNRKLSRYHEDLDISYLDKNQGPVFRAFQAAGFSISEDSDYYAFAWSQNGLKVDLFCWKRCGEGIVQHMHFRAKTMVRVPEEFFSRSQTVTLNGIQFRVPCNELIKAIIPFVKSPESIAIIESLPSTCLLTCTTSQQCERVVKVLDVTIYEFTSRREPDQLRIAGGT